MFTREDEKYMRAALLEAETALNEGEIPVGCVIADENGILASTHNLCEQTGDVTAHAELLAIKKLPRAVLRGARMYVTLEPCPMCAGAIALAGLKKLVYAARDSQYGCCGSVYRITEDPAFPSYCPADGGLLEEESRALLKRGFEKMRKK